MKRAVLLLALVAAGCSHGDFSKGTAGRKSEFSFVLDNRIPSLDPGKVQDIAMIDLCRQVYEGLVKYDENNHLVGQLATDWKPADGGRTIVFNLRKDVKFQNGRPFTAEDVKWTWERNLAPELQSAIAHDYLQAIVGVDDFIAGKADGVSGIKVIDPYTLSVSLDKPRPYFLGNLTYPCTFVLAKEAAGPKEISAAAQCVGTGPFKLTRADVDLELDLEKNANYYGGAPTLDKIGCPVVVDPATRLNKYRNGELDELSVQQQDLPSVQKDPGLSKQLKMQSRPAVYYFHLDEHHYKPFANRLVRQAFAMAFNRPHIVKDLLTGQVEAHGLLPPGLEGYQADFKGIPYDPAKAKALLAQAGFPGGAGLPPVELAYRDGSADARVVSTAAADALTQNLGVKVLAHAYDFSTLLSLRMKSKLDMVFSDWYADYLDPQNFLSLLLMTGAPQNSEGWSNPQFDALCAKADVDQNHDERIKLYQQAEEIAVDEAAKLPIYFQQDAVLVNPRVQGLQTNLFGDMQYTHVKLEP